MSALPTAPRVAAARAIENCRSPLLTKNPVRGRMASDGIGGLHSIKRTTAGYPTSPRRCVAQLVRLASRTHPLPCLQQQSVESGLDHLDVRIELRPLVPGLLQDESKEE